MSKKSVINKIKLKNLIVTNLFNKRRNLMLLLKKNLVLLDVYKVNVILMKVSKNSSKTRARNFCWHTSRTSGILTNFGLSRLSLRLLGQELLLPGLNKLTF